MNILDTNQEFGVPLQLHPSANSLNMVDKFIRAI